MRWLRGYDERALLPTLAFAACVLALPGRALPAPAGSAAGSPVLPGLGLGVVGAWYAMAADLAVRGLAMLVIFKWSRWSRAAV